MTTQTLTLTDFLLARIAEDEATARKAGKQKVAGPLIRWGADGAFLASPMFDRSERAHIARHDPARVLAECEAKRRIVESVANWCGDSASPDAHGLGETVLEHLALPYADHPDYDESWRP